MKNQKEKYFYMINELLIMALFSLENDKLEKLSKVDFKLERNIQKYH